MANLYNERPSRLLAIKNPLLAWVLDEAIAHFTFRLRNGYKLRPKKTANNMDMLKSMGMKIEGLEE